jgi:hypothetical protein
MAPTQASRIIRPLDIPRKDFTLQITVVFPRNWRWLIALTLGLLGGIILMVLFATPPAVPEVMILPPSQLPKYSGRVPDRWIPLKWDWLRRTCRFLLGAPRRVGLEAARTYDSNTVASVLASNGLGKPVAEGNGMALWILPGRTLQHPDGPPTHSLSGGVTADNRLRSKLTIGGYSVNFFERLDKEMADLWISVAYDSASATNFALAVRVQLPLDKALLLLDVRHPEAKFNRTEILITADDYDAKGNKIR